MDMDTRQQTREEIRAELTAEIRRAVAGAQWEQTYELWGEKNEARHRDHDCAHPSPENTVPCWISEHYRAFNIVLSLPELGGVA